MLSRVCAILAAESLTCDRSRSGLIGSSTTAVTHLFMVGCRAGGCQLNAFPLSGDSEKRLDLPKLLA